MVELREIETFLALSEELHFGRTAQRLHISQARVSQTIQSLERAVGGVLFARNSRSVRLTELGEQFAAGVRPAHEQLTRTLRECQDTARGVSGRLRLTYIVSIGATFVTRVAQAFEASNPRCTVVLTGAANPHALSKLAPGAADVTLQWSPGGNGDAVRGPGLRVGPVLAEVPRGVLVPADHPLAAQRTIELDDLVGYPLIDPRQVAVPDLWTPRVTPSGRRLELLGADRLAIDEIRELIVEDVLALVARGAALHLTVMTLLDRFPFPGLTLVPVRDLPPMVVVPVWAEARENALIRAFAAAAETFRRREAGDVDG